MSPTGVPPPPSEATIAPGVRRRGAAAWTMALGIVLAVLFAAIGFRASPHISAGLEGTAAPGFSLPVLAAAALPQRAELGPEASRGKVLLLHFWAPSCRPCVAEAPAWQALHAESRRMGADFDVLTVAGDEAEDVRAFLAANAYTYPVVHDAIGSAHRAYRVFSIPQTFAISPGGVIARELSGPQSAAVLRQALAAARAMR